MNGFENHLRIAKELLQPRPWQIHWRPDNIFSMVEGLGDFIPLNDMRELDDLLYDLALESGANTKISGQCEFDAKNKRGGYLDQYSHTTEISVVCDFDNEGFGRSRHFLGDLLVESGEISALPVFSRMVLDSENSILGLTHDGGKVNSMMKMW